MARNHRPRSTSWPWVDIIINFGDIIINVGVDILGPALAEAASFLVCLF